MSKSAIVFLGIVVFVVIGLVTGKISTDVIVTGATFLGVLGALVYIHEAGHYLTARRNGVTCHEFGFGFPPRVGGFVRDPKTGKRKFIFGNKEYYGNETLFSLNWIPLGGFVRIKGENAEKFEKDEQGNLIEKKAFDKDHFAAQSVWVRFKILVAGVVMNMFLAWLLYTLAAMIGAPAQTHDALGNQIDIPAQWISAPPKVLVNSAVPESAAAKMGISIGDALQSMCAGQECYEIKKESDVVDAVQILKGRDISVDITRGSQAMKLSGPLPAQVGEGEHILGVEIVQMVEVQYPPHIAAIEGAKRTGYMTMGIFSAITQLPKILISGGDQLSGPVGIAAMTGQARELGITFLMNFAAMLSVNLAVFNILPIPALDGGRILFLLIEKLKGSPINPKTEGLFHTIFFTLLILLMLYVTVKDVLKFI
jgi:regulator of sigma E protease